MVNKLSSDFTCVKAVILDSLQNNNFILVAFFQLKMFQDFFKADNNTFPIKFSLKFSMIYISI